MTLTAPVAPDRLQRRVAALSKSRPEWDPELREARQDLLVARIEKQIRQLLAAVTLSPRRALRLAAPLLEAAARDPEPPQTADDVLAALLGAKGAER